ncbi:MAG: hypothetical protein KF778_22250 [Rhodocyclaceae bacterium]|nr:hypothetical protein [Rhodocyclaceae bacterium]
MARKRFERENSGRPGDARRHWRPTRMAPSAVFAMGHRLSRSELPAHMTVGGGEFPLQLGDEALVHGCKAHNCCAYSHATSAGRCRVEVRFAELNPDLCATYRMSLFYQAA